MGTWSRDRGVARHEIAHALIARAVGLPIWLVTIVPANGALGHMRPDLAAVGGSNADTEAGNGTLTGSQAVGALLIACAVALGGPIADQIGGRRPDGQREGEEEAHMVEDLCGAEARLWMPTLRRVVEDYLRSRWSAIEVGAAALVRHGTLRDRDLDALLGEVPALDLGVVLWQVEHYALCARGRMAAS